MTTFVMMIGLSGSGKTYIARNIARDFVSPVIILESDAYRAEEFGDASIQGDNSKLFERIHRDILGHLSNGTSVIFDATNLKRGNRQSILDRVKKIGGIHTTAVLVATPYNVCTYRNRSRDRVVPEYVIRRQRESFNVPSYSEGWDTIVVTASDYDRDYYNITRFLIRTASVSQDNPHHNYTLGVHCLKAGEYADKVLNLNRYAKHVIQIHDCGKEHTKVFKNMKGEPSDIAHYYFHENVGAYESIFYMRELGYNDFLVLEAALLIELHMRPYHATSEKAVAKTKKILGNDSLYNSLLKINEADRHAH